VDESVRNALLGMIEEFFESHPDGTAATAMPLVPDRELQMAAAALMVCVVRADRTSTQDEHRVLGKAIGRTLGIDLTTAARVIRLAEAKLGEAAPFRVFIDLLNQGFTPEEKKRLVESLWRIAFADAELHVHEEYLVRKIAEHLEMDTADIIETKVRARETFLREDV
jgi:uncharacterized tellurite resistance protein B-like protein